jgi:hypothetical protein
MPFLHESSFTLEFAEAPNGDVIVRLKSFLGDSGPVRVTPADADQLTDHITAMFELLHAAQRRDERPPAKGNA